MWKATLRVRRFSNESFKEKCLGFIAILSQNQDFFALKDSFENFFSIKVGGRNVTELELRKSSKIECHYLKILAYKRVVTQLDIPTGDSYPTNFHQHVDLLFFRDITMLICFNDKIYAQETTGLW